MGIVVEMLMLHMTTANQRDMMMNACSELICAWRCKLQLNSFVRIYNCFCDFYNMQYIRSALCRLWLRKKLNFIYSRSILFCICYTPFLYYGLSFLLHQCYFLNYRECMWKSYIPHFQYFYPISNTFTC